MAETNTVANYDPSKLMDAVRDRIKAEFVGMIPEETWKQMVSAEIKRFFEAKDSNHYDRPRYSDFQRVVWEEVDKNTRLRVKAFLDSPEWQSQWDGENNVMGEAVKKLMVEKSGEMVAVILGNAVQATLSGMRSNIH